MQVAYYLYYLKQRGIEAIGIIDYPKSKRRISVELDDEREKEIENTLREIKRIESGPMPAPRRKKICKKCAYYEFCFGGEDEE